MKRMNNIYDGHDVVTRCTLKCVAHHPRKDFNKMKTCSPQGVTESSNKNSSMDPALDDKIVRM